MVFISKTMAQPQRKQAIFLNHVDLGVIELKALKHTDGGGGGGVQMMEMIGQKKKMRRKQCMSD